MPATKQPLPVDVSRTRITKEEKTGSSGGFGRFWLRLLAWVARGQRKAGTCHT